jgi:cell division septal protein FtsQ
MMTNFDNNRQSARARIDARRQGRGAVRPTAIPGPRRTFGEWVQNGKIASIPLLFGALIALVYVTASARFTVREITVEGVSLLRPAVAIQLSEARGRSIWFVNPDQVAENLRTNAYVEQASAYLTLPDQLTIVVRERRPEVRWQSGGQLFLVDADGRVMGADATAPLTGTLVIEDRSGAPIEPNTQLDPDALELARELTLRLPAELGQSPGAIAWSSDTGIVVDLGGRSVIFGRSDNLERKLQVLQLLLTEQAAFTTLDLRPETPYYRNDQPGAAPPAETP